MGLGSHVNGRSTDRGPYPCQTGELTYKKKRDHLGGRRGPGSGVGSVSQVFVAYNCLRISFAGADWSLVMMPQLAFWQKVTKMTESVLYLNVISAIFSMPSRSGSDKFLREQHCHVLLYHVVTVFRDKPLSQSRFCLILKKSEVRKNFDILKKIVFSLIFGQKIAASSNFRPRSTFLASKITFLKLWFFSDFSVFWSKIQKIGSKIQKVNFNFFKNFQFIPVFYYSRALLTTWMTDRTLQNINSSIRLALNPLRKVHFCPPTAKKILIENEV